MALPTYVNASSYLASVNAASISYVGSPQADDIFLLVVEGQGGVTAPTGWAHVTGSPLTIAAGASELSVLWRRSDGTETGTVNVGDTGDHTGGQMFLFRGCATSGDPWDAIDDAAGAVAASGTITGPTVSTSASDCLLVEIVGRDDDSSLANFSGQTNAGLANITERSDTGTTQGSGGGFALWTGELASPGTVTTTVTSARAVNWGAITLALKPPVTGPTASLNKTLGALAASATAASTVSASLTKTLGAAVLAGSATAGVSATLGKTLGSVGLSGAAAAAISASLSKSLGAVTLSSTAGQPTSVATLAVTLGASTLSASATVGVAASLSKTLGAASLSSAAQVGIGASVAKSLGSATLSATAVTSPLTVTASLNATLGALASSGTATTRIVASTAVSLGGLSATTAAEVRISASLSRSLGAVTLQGEAYPIVDTTAALAVTLGAVSLAATLRHHWLEVEPNDTEWSAASATPETWTPQSVNPESWS